MLSEKWLFWLSEMFFGTTHAVYGAVVPYSLNRPLKPHPLAAVQFAPMSDGVKSNVLSVTFTFWVIQRQSLRSGCELRPGFTQVVAVATDGSTRVHVLPALSGLTGPQNRLAFSHSTTPDQLSSKTLPVMSKELRVRTAHPTVGS